MVPSVPIASKEEDMVPSVPIASNNNKEEDVFPSVPIASNTLCTSTPCETSIDPVINESQASEEGDNTVITPSPLPNHSIDLRSSSPPIPVIEPDNSIDSLVHSKEGTPVDVESVGTSNDPSLAPFPCIPAPPAPTPTQQPLPGEVLGLHIPLEEIYALNIDTEDNSVENDHEHVQSLGDGSNFVPQPVVPQAAPPSPYGAPPPPPPPPPIGEPVPLFMPKVKLLKPGNLPNPVVSQFVAINSIKC